MEDIIVCALASGLNRVPGSSGDRECRECKSPVLMAPSSQRLLAKNPAIAVICLTCFTKNKDLLKCRELALAGSPQEISDEIIMARSWRNRN